MRSGSRTGFASSSGVSPIGITHVHMFTAAEIQALLADFAAIQITLLGGRYRRFHARLLAQDLFFRAVRPA